MRSRNSGFVYLVLSSAIASSLFKVKNCLFPSYQNLVHWTGSHARTMRPQKIGAIKASLHDMNLEELKEMSDDLASLIEVLVTRQEAVESTIVDRLAATFEK